MVGRDGQQSKDKSPDRGGDRDGKRAQELQRKAQVRKETYEYKASLHCSLSVAID